MLGRLWLAWRTIGSVFGERLVPLLVGLYMLNLRLVNTAGVALDQVFFPDLRRARVERPIVIVGNPRTGTSFLQRFLVDGGVGHGMQVWRMIAVSLCLQKIVRPFLPLIRKLDPTRFHSATVHETDIEAVEVDDVMLFPRFFDGFFPYGFFLAFHEDDLIDRVDPDKRDTAARDYGWVRTAWLRNLVANGDPNGRVVAKLFSVSARLPSFLEAFPDARVLYMVREPTSVIPSTLSLVTGVLDNMFGFWTLPGPVRARYLKRVYSGLVELLLRFERDWSSGRISRDSVYIVRFDRLMGDFENMMGELLTFVGHEPSDALTAAIRARAEKQKRFQSEHTYDLAQFGLDEDTLRRDLAPFYATFLAD